MKKKNFVRFEYTVNNPYCNFGELGLIRVDNSPLFCEAEFDNKYILLYCKDSLPEMSAESVTEEAESIMFDFKIGLLSEQCVNMFEYKLDEFISANGCTYQFARSKTPIRVTSKANASIHSTIAEEDTSDLQQRIYISNRNKISLLFNKYNMATFIDEESKRRLIRLMCISDPVIKYFIMYTWLYDINITQEKTDSYIKSYQTENGIAHLTPPERKADRLSKGRYIEKLHQDTTFFTYLRNLLGHSAADALSIEDKTLIDQYSLYAKLLLPILMKALEDKGQN